MMLKLSKYGSIISDQAVGEEIYNEISKILQLKENCVVDFSSVKSMATFNAKQIFGKLYLQLSDDSFFNKIEIKNASNDLRLIIKLGIQSAIEDHLKAK